MAQALSEGAYQSRRVQAGVDLLAERLQEMYDRNAIDDEELDERMGILDRVEDLSASYKHTGPGLMGDDFTLQLCAKLNGK